MNRLWIIIGLSAALVACSTSEKDYDASGTFEATEVVVSAEQNGRLMSFNVIEGDVIEQGAQVGVIDTVQLILQAQQLGATRESIASQRPDMNKQIAATRQQIAKAEQEVKRYTQLVNDAAANRKQLEDAQSQLVVLRKQLEAQVSTINNSTRSLDAQVSSTDITRRQVLDQLSKCYISAPITGTVLEKYTEAGEFAVVGKPLFKIADMRHVYLRAYISSRRLSEVKTGQQVRVFADYGSETKKEYKGTVTWISDQAEFTPKSILTDDERGNLAYAVKIAVVNEDGNIKLGMYGEVKF